MTAPEIKKLNLAMVGTEFFRSRGGIQYVNCALAGAFASFAARTPAQIGIFSLNDRPAAEQAQSWPRDIFAWHAFNRSRGMLGAALTVFLTRSKPHAVLFTHVHTLRLAPLVRALSPETRIAALAHGVEVWSALPFGLRRSLQSCEEVLAPSQYTRDQLIKKNGVEAARIRVLAHGLDSHWSTAPIPPRHTQGTGRKILTVSRLVHADREKGIEQLLQAMPWVLRDVPDAHLEIAGDGPDRPRLETLAADTGVAPHVTFLGELADERLQQAYSRADVFALPSKKEGFGIVFLEAMLYGLPVVAVRAGGTVDVVEDGVTGLLVPPDNPSALASALSGLLLVPEERHALGVAGQRRVRENFLFTHFADRWHNWLAGFAPEAVYLARHMAAFANSERVA